MSQDIWFLDIYIDRIVDVRQVDQSLPSVFDINSSEVCIFEDWLYPEDTDGIKVRCNVTDRSNDRDNEFPTSLELIIDSALAVSGEFIIIGKLCALLSCHALIDDHGDNPYYWMLVTDTGSAVKVSISYTEKGMKLDRSNNL